MSAQASLCHYIVGAETPAFRHGEEAPLLSPSLHRRWPYLLSWAEWASLLWRVAVSGTNQQRNAIVVSR
jgi:hypothetical protein